MITKTDAFVVKSMRYRDTSKIVTFYSQRFGKIKGIAKGARETKSKFGSSLDPMTLASLVLYKKENRDLQFISECDTIRPYKLIHSELERMEAALSVLDLVNRVTHDEEKNSALYSLLGETFENIENAVGNYGNFYQAFVLRMASLFGFAPMLMVCPECKKVVEESDSTRSYMFEIGKGAVYCDNCAMNLGKSVLPGQSRIRISARTVGIMREFLQGKLEHLAEVEFNKVVGNELDETLRLYLQYHFEGLKPLKSKAVFQQMNA